MTILQRKETLARQVARILADRIASGDSQVGGRLPTEQELIDEFSVSRTVVREAIAQLRALGLVTIQHGVGAFILPKPNAPFRIDQELLGITEEILAVLDLRIALESEAAALAAVRREREDIAKMEQSLAAMAAAIEAGEDSLEADLGFHRAIAAATRNAHFINLFNYLGELVIPRSRLQTFKLGGMTRADYVQRIHSEHLAIADAIKWNDEERARAAMRAHLSGSKDRLRRHMKPA
jgi:DNA-binding FadR family transcriptional regulator